MPRRNTTTAIEGGDTTGLDDAMLRCRLVRHRWDEFYPTDMGTPAYGWRLSLRCDRCTAERHDLIDYQGRLIPGSRRYIYPDGYRMQRDETPSRESMMLDLFGRVRARLAKSESIGALEEAS
jgi:hypothetical protein